jgi:histidyl-tRNA synthetase
MDKRDKVSPETLGTMLKDVGMTSSQVQHLNEYLTKTNLQELKEELQHTEGIDELQHLLQLMDTAGYSDYLQFDISIVRGLSYYTGAVFEINSPEKQHRAICGGGRYDSLLSTYGGKSVPAVGFGFGDVVVLDVLRELERFPELTRTLDYTIIPFDNEQVGIALKIANELRSKGAIVDCNFSMKKMKKSLHEANESGAKFAILLFPEELKQEKVVIRDMQLREQNPINITDLISSAGQAA